MAPGVWVDDMPVHDPTTSSSNGSYPKPLRQSGALESFEYEDTTPVIGREFIDVNIVDDILGAKNAEQLLRDVAITSNNSPLSPIRAFLT